MFCDFELRVQEISFEDLFIVRNHLIDTLEKIGYDKNKILEEFIEIVTEEIKSRL